MYYFYHYSIRTESGYLFSNTIKSPIKVLSHGQYRLVTDKIEKTDDITEPYVVMSFSYLGRYGD